MIDVETWCSAEAAVEVRCGLIQGFFNESSGVHYVRDLTRTGDQVIWRGSSRGGDYDLLHDQMMREIRKAQVRIISEKYDEMVQQ